MMIETTGKCRIRILRASDLWLHPELAETMYSDRRRQFQERLGWPVNIDGLGYERDEYDHENPIYIIIEDQAGRHAGSMRLLPTTGKTMICDHFLETTGGTNVRDSRIWECTRFCLAPGGRRRVASMLLAVGARIIQEAGLEKFVAIFDQKMKRQYALFGVKPQIIGQFQYPAGRFISGFWEFDRDSYLSLMRKSGIDFAEMELAIANVNFPWIQDLTRKPGHLKLTSQAG